MPSQRPLKLISMLRAALVAFACAGVAQVAAETECAWSWKALGCVPSKECKLKWSPAMRGGTFGPTFGPCVPRPPKEAEKEECEETKAKKAAAAAAAAAEPAATEPAATTEAAAEEAAPEPPSEEPEPPQESSEPAAAE